ncbi:MAG: prepilin-type N-terminal cleavage/methylation domain-containing protein [Proteobacteria bacterium]|nr:MAG: prepilin-type N-terminal cleavage/methylation domain-containing protein [Pseudomonadota bacterium]
MRSLPVANLKRSQGGFTLIEVMIAVTLLAFVSIMIAQATTRSFNINITLGRESTEYSGIILSLQAVESDLAQIYSPTMDTEGPAPAAAQTSSSVMSGLSFWSAPLRADGLRRSRLNGTREKITFINNGGRRLEADEPVSDFQQVTWEIERNDSGTYSLYRTVDWDAFRYEENNNKKPSRVAVLENISSGKFSYYRRENKTWEEVWDSESPYAKAENRFPDMISLKLEVPDPLNNANNQPWEIVVRPNLPLNGEIKPTDAEMMSQ